jgi:hypothetical protein
MQLPPTILMHQSTTRRTMVASQELMFFKGMAASDDIEIAAFQPYLARPCWPASVS